MVPVYSVVSVTIVVAGGAPALGEATPFMGIGVTNVCAWVIPHIAAKTKIDIIFFIFNRLCLFHMFS